MPLSGKSIKILEGIAVVSGLLYTFLYLYDVFMPEGFFFAIAGAGIFMFLCIRKEIYAESFLHLFYIVTGFIGIALYGSEFATKWPISWHLYLIAASVLKGLESNLEDSGVDIGESQDLAEEKVIDDTLNENIEEKNVISEDISDNESINTNTSSEEVTNEENSNKKD